MKIIIEQSKYHRFALYCSYSPEYVDFFRSLKNSFGWQKFSFTVDGELKRWTFSDSLLVPVIQERFPEVIIDPAVKEIVDKEQVWAKEQNKRNEKIDQIREKKDTDFHVKGLKKELYNFQRAGVEFLVASGGRAIVADQMGCISGDAEIIVNRGGCARKITLRGLYKKINGGESKGKKWNRSILSRTRTLTADGLFCLNAIKKVIYQGEKKTVSIVAINNEGKRYSLEATPDHRIAVPQGWKEAGKLKRGDRIIVNGELSRWCNVCKKETPHALSEYTRKYRPKNYGKCKKCIYRFERNNYRHPVKRPQALKLGEHLDRNGYIYVSNAYFHPKFLISHKKFRAIFKHILVYEAYKNNLSYEEWLTLCSTNRIPLGSYFHDSVKYVIHHKDQNKRNNDIGNLERLSASEHGHEHQDKNIRNLTYNLVPGYAEILSVKEGRFIDVYDIQMRGAEPNFIVNGVVVHNCGKTLQALGYITHNNIKRTLVVCPASVKFVWENEIKKWTNLSSVVIDSKTDLSKIDAGIELWIINYDILSKHLAQLLKIRFDAIIGDEATLIKAPGAKRTKAFRQIARNILSVVLLSGTPLLSRPSELFSLLNIIDPQTWNNWYEYARKFCNLRQTRWGMDSSGASNIDELHARIKRYFIRRNKSEVLTELPPKTFVSVPVQLDKETARRYNSAATDLAAYLRMYAGKQPPEIAKALSAEKLTQLNTLRQLCAVGKFEMATELIESVIESGEKVLVFCSFNEPLESLKTYFGDKAVILTGKTPVSERQGIVERFQNDNKVSIFLGGIKSAGIGITLTAAANVIFLDRSWNPADMVQAQDRAHRIGTTHESINIYNLSVKGTIDEDMEDILEHKQGIFDRVIEGKVDKEVASEAMDAAVQRILKDY